MGNQLDRIEVLASSDEATVRTHDGGIHNAFQNNARVIILTLPKHLFSRDGRALGAETAARVLEVVEREMGHTKARP